MKTRFIKSVEGEHHEKAVELLKAAQGSVKLVVRYTPKVLEEMEARFEKMRSARRRQQHTSYSVLSELVVMPIIHSPSVNWINESSTLSVHGHDQQTAAMHFNACDHQSLKKKN
ncbi:hypothetical protein INR49_028173 [Caranx melampygus]|nr:hypothetical protein INR49_028173 [Caranx melampygus]